MSRRRSQPASQLTFIFPVFDSWGKVPSGITFGHLVGLGNFQQCIQIDFKSNSSATNNETNIKGKYCQAILPILEIVEIVRPQSAFLDSYTRGAVERPNVDPPIGIGVGVCFPKVCSNKKIAAILTEALKVKIQVNICRTNEKPDFEAMDYVAAFIFGIIGFLLIISTFYDVYTTARKIPKTESLLAFSVINNSQKLFAINLKSSPSAITCLHGIRSLSMMWVVYGHSFLWYFLQPILNLRTVDAWSRSVYSMLIETAIISVDTFFFLSGLLIAWIGLKELEKNHGKLNVIMMYVHRLFRLLPLIGILILFTLSFLKYFGSGPHWPVFLAMNTYPCEKTWWRTVLFINNYKNELVVSFSYAQSALYIKSPGNNFSFLRG